MRVFLTGASGFIGRHIIRRLHEAGHSVRALVRKRASDLPTRGELEIVEGDVTDPASLGGLLQHCQAVVHLVGIIDEKPSKGITFDVVHDGGTRSVVDAAKAAGVERFVHMSANGAREKGVSAYQTSKWKAEQYVQQAEFEHWVIFRPTVVFGDPGDDQPEFSRRIASTLVKPFPILPVPGNGLYEMQPLSIDELSQAFAQAVDRTTVNRKIYCAAGKERVSFNEILDRIAVALGGDPKPKIHHPLWMVRPAVRTGLAPLSIDQLEMLVEGNTCDSSMFYHDFHVSYRPYTPENLGYLRKYV